MRHGRSRGRHGTRALDRRHDGRNSESSRHQQTRRRDEEDEAPAKKQRQAGDEDVNEVVAEGLETRTLLTAAETFTGPSLIDLILLARQGKDTAPAAIERMLQSLETQLTGGPLADLGSGAVDGNGFVQEVQSLESSYEQNVDQQLSPEFPNVDKILKLAGPGDRGRRDFAEPAKHGRVALELGSGCRPPRPRSTL